MTSPHNTIGLDSLGLELKSELPAIYKLLPRQVILYWIEGRFAGAANRTTKYNKLGWGLLMRGFYWYRVDEIGDSGNKRFHHAGFCIVDLDDADLFLGGIRLLHFADKMNWEPFLWRSTILKHTAKPENSVLEFAYGTVGLSGNLLESTEEGTELRHILQLCETCFKAKPSGSEPTADWFQDPSQSLARWLDKNLNEVWSNHEGEAENADMPFALVKGNLDAGKFTSASPEFHARYLRISQNRTDHRDRTISFMRINPWLART